MVDMPHGEKLSRKKEQAIAALLARPTVQEAAAEVGISVRTLCEWLKHPVFKRAYGQARESIFRTWKIDSYQRLTAMRLEQRLTRLERVADQREAAAIRATDHVGDRLTALLRVATIEELRRLRKVFDSLRLGQPTDVQRGHFLSFATEDEVDELGRIFEVLKRRLAAQRAAGRSGRPR
jgi:hypothetical protein